MPHPIKSARAKPSSNSPASPPQKSVAPSPQFTKSKQSSPSNSPDQPEKTPDSAEWLSSEKLSLDATEPFPPGLFRVPVPNAVFDRMPELSDSALRCLLALVDLSFRFDPASGEWIHAGDWFTRSDIEGECGLSNQGTRNGLSELESIGWACVDRSGRSHRYQLDLKVPNQRFTYVPTALLEGASGLGSGTELRVVLAVLRKTWGWTCKETDPQSGSLRTVHDRWIQLPNRKLTEATGRSETSVVQATRALQGTWIEQVRPGSGPYQYRFLPEAIGDGSRDPDSFSGDNANDLPPHRQKSDPPSFNKESFSKDKHSSQSSKRPEPRQKKKPPPNRENAVPPDNQHRKKSTAQSTRTDSAEQSPDPDFSNLSPEKRDLAEKLQNVGVWAGRIAELLSRFSLARIRANFELYRRRTAHQTIHTPGAWLSQAIVEGYALPSSNSEGSSSSATNGSLSPLEHKQTVSKSEKEAYVVQGISEERFYRCVSDRKGPRFMYFAPGTGGPDARR